MVSTTIVDTSARYQTKTLAENGAFKKVGFPGRLLFGKRSITPKGTDIRIACGVTFRTMHANSVRP